MTQPQQTTTDNVIGGVVLCGILLSVVWCANMNTPQPRSSVVSETSSSSERSVSLARSTAIFCPNLSVLRQYVEVNHEKWGGDGCIGIFSENVRSVSIVGEEGNYVRVVLQSQQGESVSGYMKREAVH